MYPNSRGRSKLAELDTFQGTAVIVLRKRGGNAENLYKDFLPQKGRQ